MHIVKSHGRIQQEILGNLVPFEENTFNVSLQSDGRRIPYHLHISSVNRGKEESYGSIQSAWGIQHKL